MVFSLLMAILTSKTFQSDHWSSSPLITDLHISIFIVVLVRNELMIIQSIVCIITVWVYWTVQYTGQCSILYTHCSGTQPGVLVSFLTLWPNICDTLPLFLLFWRKDVKEMTPRRIKVRIIAHTLYRMYTTVRTCNDFNFFSSNYSRTWSNTVTARTFSGNTTNF